MEVKINGQPALTPEQTCTELDCSMATLYRLQRSGELVPVRAGGTWYEAERVRALAAKRRARGRERGPYGRRSK